MQEILTILLHHFESQSQQFISFSKSSESHSVKQSIKSSSHYLHLSFFTSTSTRQQPIFKSDTKWSVFKSETKQFEEENTDYNDYDMKNMNKKCVSAWKEEEHEYH